MAQKEFKVEDYHISYLTGFLLEKSLPVLPDYFERWNYLAGSLCDLINEKRLREEVHKIPLLDHTKLKGYRELRLARLQLSFITAGYVWQDGDNGAAKVLPSSIAIPFYHIAKELGMPPILCHSDAVLANFKLTDLYGSYYDLGNIDCHYLLPGGEHGKPFITVTILMELAFAKCLQPMETIINHVEQSKSNKEESWQYYNMKDIIYCLNDIRKSIGDMKTAFSLMHDELPVAVFFNNLRPFLSGWGGEGNILPEGLIYEGVSDEPIQLAGGSAAQSTTLQALDAFFGIRHSGYRQEFLNKMRGSMPPDHVRFILAIEQRLCLPSYVENMDVPDLTTAYNECISALTDFRSYHIGIVYKYIIAAAKDTNEGNYESLDEKGTGGTDLIPFLKGLLQNTQGKILKTSAPKTEGQEKTPSGGKLSLIFGLSAFGILAFMIARHKLV